MVQINFESLLRAQIAAGVVIAIAVGSLSACADGNATSASVTSASVISDSPSPSDIGSGVRDPSASPPSESPLASVTPGVIDEGQTGVSPDKFEGMNFWRGPSPVTGKWIMVDAGLVVSQADRTATPGVMIQSVDGNPNNPVSITVTGMYTDPSADNALQIVSESNDMLYLRTLAFYKAPEEGQPSPSGSPTPGPTNITFNLRTDVFSQMTGQSAH